MATDNDNDEGSEALRFLKLTQTHTTIRYFCVTAGVVIGLGIIAWAVVRIAERETTAYDVALAIVAAIAASIAVPTIQTIRAKITFRRYIAENHRRTVELETKVDPGRTSSGLLEDGRNEHGI